MSKTAIRLSTGIKSADELSVMVLMYSVSSAFNGAVSVQSDKASACASGAVDAADVEAAAEAASDAAAVVSAGLVAVCRLLAVIAQVQDTAISATAKTAAITFQSSVGFFCFIVPPYF